MLRKSFVFILLITLSSVFAYSQKLPKAEKDKKTNETYRVFFGGGSYLGVYMKEVTKENFSSFGLSEVRGVAIEKVAKDSPAEKAGLKAGDVITRFNGESVTSVRKLRRLISEVSPDHKVNMTVIRNGREQQVSATVGKRRLPEFSNSRLDLEKYLERIPKVPPMPPMPPMSRMPRIQVRPLDKGVYDNFVWRISSNRAIGVSTMSLTKQLGDYFGVADGKGILISNVKKDSPAEKAGLKAGDVIIEIDGEKVKGHYDLLKALGEKEEGDVNLTVLRNKNRRTFKVTPEKRKDGVRTINGFRYKTEKKEKDKN